METGKLKGEIRVSNEFEKVLKEIPDDY